MTALPGWPAVSGAATFQHIRRALAGQIARDSSGGLRKGILPHTTAALVTGTATMNVAVGAFVAVLDRNGAVLLANDGAVNVLLSSAPASGSRWSVVYVKQRETEAPFSDGVAGPILDKVESTTSEAAARALLPAGALELAVVQVNAGSANTNAVGVTITQTAPFTASTGGTVLIRNSTDLAAWTPDDAALAFRIDNGFTYQRVSGAWEAIDSPWTAYTPTWSSGGGGVALGNGTLNARYRYIARRTVKVRIELNFGSTTNGGLGAYSFSLPSGLTAHATGEQLGTAKAFTSGSNNWGGITTCAAGATTLQPWFPLAGGDPRLDVARNSTAGATGTGIPQISAAYTYATGHKIVMDIIVELA